MVADSQFIENRSEKNGGAISNRGFMRVFRSVFNGNKARVRIHQISRYFCYNMIDLSMPHSITFVSSSTLILVH